MSLSASDFTTFDLEGAAGQPRQEGIYRLLKNRWVAVDENGRGLIYKGGSIQCNTEKSIVEHILKSENHPAVGVKFVEILWQKVNPRDWQ